MDSRVRKKRPMERQNQNEQRGSVALHTALYQAARMARLYDYTLQISITIIENK
jgi:hypothetical protein